MRVILLETVGNLGVVGDVVNVRQGYARNYLLPRKIAVSANERNLKQHAHQQRILEHKLKRARKKSEEVRRTLEGMKITVERASADGEKLFGSVTAIDVEKALSAESIVVARKCIDLHDPIKKAGKYKIDVKLDGGLNATLNVEVVANQKLAKDMPKPKPKGKGKASRKEDQKEAEGEVTSPEATAEEKKE